MALSYYSTWDAILQQDSVFHSTRLFDDIIPPPPELDFGALPPDSYFNVDSFFEPDPENVIPLLTAPPPQYDCCIFTSELDSFDSMKRHKLIVDDVVVPPANENSGGRSLSPQSIAARQRRRKISEKTRELGKLVPGGMRMNTAEMFGAAYKYIQYLQAQVGILEFMADHHGAESFESEQLLHGLLESTSIQEKLYSTEKCMVPRAFVRELANDQEVAAACFVDT